MDKLSFISFMSISFPEQIIVFILGTLFIGKKSILKSLVNIVKVVFISLLMSALNYIIRKYLNYELEITIFSMLLFTLLLIFVLKYRFYEAISLSVFGFLLILIIEIPMSLLLKNLLEITSPADLYNNYSKLVPWVFSVRFMQIITIILLYKFDIKVFDMENSNIKKKEFYIQIAVYLISILSLAFLTIIMAKVLIFNDNISESSNNLLRMNICITLFITATLTVAVRDTYSYYKNKNVLNNNELIQNIDLIYDMITQKNYREAKEALQNLKSHINKN
ncbi:hypothetical protein [Acetivibrio saccincola]|uniref:Uncharacterized protein n=1 Tax=Acetivibrio saccincola TaxID=1677857 RepID=A0A2S8R7M8_9FIRM|nr:hypothetical protein [Acetivibrio saccincola]PQQ65795.1 hypothetical protein B9R14_02765 [Acetivibrio saccincola]